MAKKIILFLSEDRENSKEYNYTCPDGTIVRGAQSNDAPTRYLLQHYREVSEIICITTKEVKKASYQRFSDMIKEENPDIKICDVSFGEKGTKDFIQKSIPQILRNVHTGDEILLETTGGFRNAVMYLLLISKILSYSGIETIGAVYSNYNEKKVEDLLQLIGMFDLIGGMQELSSFGAVQNIRTYYEKLNITDEKINQLFDAVEDLMETITLCRTGLIDEKMKKFDLAMEEAENCSDKMMRQLLPAFRKKFGSHLTILSLIEWCVNSGMLQQALTIYNERIPAFIMGEGGFIEVSDSVQKPMIKDYEDEKAVLFTKNFLRISKDKEKIKRFRKYLDDNKEQIKKDVQEGGMSLVVQAEFERGIENMYYLLNIWYPNFGGFDKKWKKKLSEKKAFLKDLEKWLDKENIPKNKVSMVEKFTKIPEEQAYIVLEEAIFSRKEIGHEVITLKKLESLLPDSGFTVKCSIEQIKQISRDYLYIRTLRNLTNHASHTEKESQKELLYYLEECGYSSIENITTKKISDAILKGLQYLQL